MKGPWKAYAFLAALAVTVLVVSTSAFAVGGHPRRAADPSQWRTSFGATTWSGRLTALYPGVGNDTEVKAITVTNDGSAAARLLSVTASIATTAAGDTRTTGGGDIRGCRATWFTVWIAHGSRALPAEIGPGKTYTGQVDMVMRDTSSDQDACRRASPAITVSPR